MVKSDSRISFRRHDRRVSRLFSFCTTSFETDSRWLAVSSFNFLRVSPMEVYSPLLSKVPVETTRTPSALLSVLLQASYGQSSEWLWDYSRLLLVSLPRFRELAKIASKLNPLFIFAVVNLVSRRGVRRGANLATF